MAEDKKGNADKGAEEAGAQGQQAEEKEQYEPKEQMLRLAAEFDNYKKRMKNEMDRAKGIGKAELAERMLPILDEFELALIAANGSGDKAVAKGMELVYSNFKDVLTREGLREIPAEGAVDPYRHEAIMVKESDKRPGTILEVVKKGYMFGDILLRPAAVIVAKDGKVEK